MTAGPLIALGAPPAVVLTEAATSTGFDPYSLIGTVVTPVIVVALLLLGKLHTDADYKRVIADLDHERAERVRFQSALTERVVPALTRATLVLEAVSPSLQQEVRLRAAREEPL